MDAVGTRLKAYHAQTAPLIGHYAGQDVLERVDAMGAIASTLGTVVQAAASR